MQHQSEMVQTESGLLVPAGLKVGGTFLGQIKRDGQIIDEFEMHNLVVNEGLNHLLNVTFNGVTQVGTWYLGLFEGNYTPVSTLTAATVASSAVECTAYASSTRPEFVEATSTAQSITNSANRASFVMNASKTVYGAFLVSSNAKNGTGGVLFSATRFSAAKVLENTDELLLTYTFGATSA